MLPVTLHQVLAFGVAAFVIIVAPGPSVLFVVGRALAYGRVVALSSVLGNTTGLFVVMVLVSVGVGTLVARSVALFTVVKLLGAGYLVWLGVQALRHRTALHVEAESGALLSARAAARQGFVVGLTNPKAFMIFAAVLPPFVDRAAGQVPAQMLTLGTLAVLLGLVTDTVWALLASALRHWFNASPARGRALGTTGGLSMVGLGVALAATGRPD